MRTFKVQFHCHTKKDPSDWIEHTEEELIDHAARYSYDVLSITCHNKIIFDKDLFNYADKKYILLIPGIEKTIEGKHVLLVNAAMEAENVETFHDLSKYKKDHPETLIVAPHPYHPVPIGLISLKNNLDKNVHLFDAIEWSCFRTPKFNFNKKAVEKAKEFKLPLLGTADNHLIKYLNYSYSYVNAAEKTPDSIINAIRAGNLRIESIPISVMGLLSMTARLTFLEQIKKLMKLFKTGQ